MNIELDAETKPLHERCIAAHGELLARIQQVDDCDECLAKLDAFRTAANELIEKIASDFERDVRRKVRRVVSDVEQTYKGQLASNAEVIAQLRAQVDELQHNKLVQKAQSLVRILSEAIDELHDTSCSVMGD